MKGRLLAGRYQVEEELGRGGMATVYRAFDRSLERQVAVKILHRELATDEDIVARFRAEAQAAARLSHPSIAQIFDTGADDGDYFIVMEYLPEPDLKTIIRDYAPLPPHKVAEVAMQACEALGYAHQHGIIHRDVKPHNILFTTDGRAKLVDFGIAAAVGERSREGTLIGSAHYLSPEEVRGNAPTPQSDLYSLGVVMYECLTGRTPFQGETAEAVIAKRMAGPPPAPRSLNPGLSPAAEHVVMKAMARDANQRYQSAGEMLADLRRLVAGAPVQPVRETDATKTLVLPRAPEAVTPGPLREAPRGPRQPAPAAPPRKEGVGWAWGVGGFLIGVIALVALVYLFQYLFYPGAQHAAFVSVPGVTGQSQGQARQVLEDAKLSVGKVREDPSSQQAPGTVVSQEPGMGEHVPEGTRVNLVVAAVSAETKENVVEVIRVVSLPLDDAETLLRRVHLKLGKVTEVYDETAAKGDVLAQDVPPGTEVAEWQEIGLTVSKGPKPPTVEGTETTGPGGEQPPEGKAAADADPDFAYTEVPGFSDDPTIRQFQVTVIAQGAREHQHIQLYLHDDRNVRSVVAEQWLDPGQKIEKTVTTHGSASFELYRDGEPVGRAPLPLPSGPAPAEAPGEH
jgi:tRNA A-37 threonylcarbamoyl transferase component Bud32